jgi:AcrR family transcriptional regulator
MASSRSHSPASAKRRPASERLLEAAARIFARDGLSGATTREIARAAGVNEVTLFRHFHTKENLVSAVAERMVGSVSGEQFRPKPLSDESVEWMESLQGVSAILAGFAKVYYGLLSGHLPLIRTFIGEIHRHHSQEECVIKSIFHPHRQQFMEQLQAAQDQGRIRKDVNLVLAADHLSGMIFTNVLRQGIFLPDDYTVEEYLAGCVKMVAESIEARPATGKRPLERARRAAGRPASNGKAKKRGGGNNEARMKNDEREVVAGNS